MTELFNIKSKKQIRRNLRKQDIGAEKALWYKLRRNNLGYRFRRQFGIGNYVVDFYCPKLKLIIELDGATHSTEEEINNDTKREDFLKKLSLNIKRYPNGYVYENIDLVIDDIINTIDDLKIKYAKNL